MDRCLECGEIAELDETGTCRACRVAEEFENGTEDE